MKKYLLKLIDADIELTRKMLVSTEDILIRYPNDKYWVRRKTAQLNKIEKALKYREKVVNNQQI